MPPIWPVSHCAVALLISLSLLPKWCALCYSTQQPPRPIPITVLSGFLGSGKTTLLQRLLRNGQGLRIAVIVNDVASVNIDSKLVKSGSGSSGEDQAGAPAGLVELQNGCACCSQAEELLSSVAELVTLSDLRGEYGGDDDGPFDHIVIECSGVADPKGIRAQFQQAALYQMPLLERVQLDTMVTVVDAASYLEYLASDKIASPDETPELYYPNGQAPEQEEEDDDDDLENLPPGLRALLGRNNNDKPLSTEESVAALLISQTETADVILLNKCDLATAERLEQIEAIVRACAPSAVADADSSPRSPSSSRIHRCTYAKVHWNKILAVAGGLGVAMSGMVDDHRGAVLGALAHSHDKEKRASSSSSSDHSHSHDHDSHKTNGASAKSDHSHSHDHGAHNTNGTTAIESDHDHSHQHTHEQSHDHSHSHDHHHHDDCDDPNCTDPSHNHGFATTEAHGISTLVYQARRPFHPGRLLTFLRKLPIRMGLPDAESDTPEDHPVLSKIVRSKGFCWCADSNRVAYYWSQAGPSFELSKVGAWWATLPREHWPPSSEQSILSDFDDPNHDDASSIDGKSVGDRRQEVVLIGTSLGTADNQAIVRECLDQCLLQDDEWQEFLKYRNNEAALHTKFPASIISRLLV